jgi:MFS-type transporter involved in bile tolerance (Atg22 family)
MNKNIGLSNTLKHWLMWDFTEEFDPIIYILAFVPLVLITSVRGPSPAISSCASVYSSARA